MASYESYDLNDTHCADLSQGNVVRIFHRVSRVMEYVGVIGSKHCPANSEIFPKLCELSFQNPTTFPEMLYPSRIEGCRDFIIPIKCFIEQSVSNFPSDWFFEKILELNVPKSLYFTFEFKYFIYSLTKIVLLFLPTMMRPVIDPNHMFVNHTGDVIFTKYEKRSGHDWEFEREKLVTLLQLILDSHANNSRTLECEMNELMQYLRNADSGTVLDDLLGEIVFWTPEMRVQYIYQLSDRVLSRNRIITHLSNEIAIYSKSRDAFLVNGSNKWYKTIKESGNQHFVFVYNQGNKHVDLKEILTDREASKYRTFKFAGKSDSFILVCGLVRLRDGCLHVGGYEFPDNIPRSDVDIQAMYQDLFPEHMVQFKNLLQYVPYFDAKGRVVKLLGVFQNEASTS